MVILIAMMVWSQVTPPVVSAPYNYSDLLTEISGGAREIEKIYIKKDSDSTNSAVARVTMKNGDIRAVEIIDLAGFNQIVNELIGERGSSLLVETHLPDKTGWIVSLITPLVFMLLSVFLLFFLFQQAQGGGAGGRAVTFARSRAKIVVDEKNKVTFSSVAGLIEEKGELEELVEFLRNPDKYRDIGARIPKGVLLVGPPGTGKTLLARAVAGEAGVPFFSISGSDFVEMYVGVGASRVRDLFDQAKRQKPAIVFIDEIDAVGRRRGAGLGGGHDEREQTLNQLLVEMDGFGVNEGVIILAATNRADILDPALLRPGRFDRRVHVGVPDVRGREDILRVHSRGKKLAEDVDLKAIAQSTAGFTGADLENMLNEAALLAARHDRQEISQHELRLAFVKLGVGTEKKSKVYSERVKKLVAYHEIGHAIAFEALDQQDHVHIVSLIPTGAAGGYTMPMPTEDETLTTKTRLEQSIVVSMGGRAAEEIVFGDITTGASSDIQNATNVARSMVTRYGMSEKLGPIQFGDDANEVFIGRDLAHARNFGEGVAAAIDGEINRIINGAFNEAKRLLNEHIEVLHKGAALLIEKEKLTGDEFRALFKSPLPEKLNKPARDGGGMI
jgi:cell division protease FtsH